MPERSDAERTRGSFADRVPRPSKRVAGRTDTPDVPANIRATDVTIDEDEREYIRRRLGEKLGRFSDSIERVTVRLRDINGARGGVDQECSIKIVLSGLPSVVFESRDTTMKVAINDAVIGVERAVRRAVQRRRMLPLKRASGDALNPTPPEPRQS